MQYEVGDKVFGNWKLVRLIGEGSFGKVYEAQREDFGRTYKAAIKIITIPQSESELQSVQADGLDDESVTSYFRGFVEELVDEFAVMSDLKGHSNIVSYEDHTVVPHTDGIGWDIMIRMELLMPLIQHIRINTMTQRDIIQLGIDLCRALELCQKYKIIHRDIKPENIFISPAGDFKLGDFGIARTAEKTTSGMSKKGTYTYMAPEVYRDQPYGTTVDIYSLGIVLYWLLNENRSPFLPAYPAAITHSDRERALRNRMGGEEIPAPKNADARLAEIVLKACAYNPKERYSSPVQMRQELEAILYDQREAAVIFPDGDELPARSVRETPSERTLDATESAFPSKRTGHQAPAGTEEEDKTESAFGHGQRKAGLTFGEDRTESIFGAGRAETEQTNFSVVEKEIPGVDGGPAEEPAVESMKGDKSWIWLAIVGVVAILALSFSLFWQHSGDSVSGVEVQMVSLSHVQSAAGNYSHGFALLEDGTLQGWGKNCGDASGLRDIVAIDAGCDYTLALDSNGNAWAWGHNSFGEGCVADSDTPVCVASNVTAMAAGDYHALLVKEDGTVWSWGCNDFGQLGVGSYGDTSSPVQVLGLEQIVAVSAGNVHSIALDSNGAVWSWGCSGNGRLGHGAWPGTGNQTTPIRIQALDEVVAISAGSSHSLALKRDGSVWAWGSGSGGELGNGNTIDINSPIRVEGPENAIEISAAGGQSLALTEDGNVWAWGTNYLPEETTRLIPEFVLDGIRHISACGDYNLAVDQNGVLLAWGGEREEIDAKISITPAPILVKDESSILGAPNSRQEYSSEPLPESTPSKGIENSTREDIYDSDGALCGYWLHYRDESGCLMRIEMYSLNGILNETIYYDKEGELVRQEYYNSNGVLSEYWLYYPDGKGNVAWAELYNSDGTLCEYWQYFYDDSGNLTREEKYAQDGTLSITYRNEAGYITREETYSSDGTLQDSWDAPG